MLSPILISNDTGNWVIVSHYRTQLLNWKILSMPLYHESYIQGIVIFHYLEL